MIGLMHVLGTSLLVGALAFVMFTLIQPIESVNTLAVAQENGLPEPISSQSTAKDDADRDPTDIRLALARPLFAPDRRPRAVDAVASVEPATTTESTPNDAPVPSIALLGVLQDDGREAALLSIDGGEPTWFVRGSELGGWRLTLITKESIEISRDDIRERVELYDQ